MELRDQLQGTLGTAYTLERELGGGGMSRVFVAMDTTLGRPVVVKVLAPDLAGDVDMDRFRREVRLAATLQHPHIVPLLSAGETNGIPYYTMPFVEGQSLRERLRATGALPLGEALGILRDVAKALAYAHARGVMHRDIKPDNVLLSGGVAVVADFGIAKAIASSSGAGGRTSLTMKGMAVGTPAYMAPEQAAADPDTDHRADLYAFGCMAYELFTGQPPFAEVPARRRLAAQLAAPPAPISSFRPDVPRQLHMLIMRCLEKDPAGRPQRAEELSEVLDSIVARRSAQLAVPTAQLIPAMLGTILMLYIATSLALLLVVRAAIAWVHLPGWALTVAMILAALGLPIALSKSWTHYRDRRAASDAPRTAGQ